MWQYDEIYVHEVLRGFAGEEQGVQRDDVILAIDGTVRSADPGGQFNLYLGRGARLAGRQTCGSVPSTCGSVPSTCGSFA